MMRLNHTLRMEYDQGYHALRHHIFKNYSILKGFRLFKKVPKTRGNNNNECVGLYEKKSKSKSINNIEESFITDLYLGENRIELPNDLIVKSSLDIIRNYNNDKGTDSEKFYFKLELKCNIFNNSIDNLNYLMIRQLSI